MTNFFRLLLVLSNFSKHVASLFEIVNRFTIHDFLTHKINPNTILVTDPIRPHGEVMPGVIKYCQDLGYNVEVLITNDKKVEKPFPMFKKLKVFSFGNTIYYKALQLKKMNQYKYIIFTSCRVYSSKGIHFIFDYRKNDVIPPEKFLLIEHHLELISQKELQKYTFLALPFFADKFHAKMINPHYFGEIPLHKKNKKIKFVVAGVIENKRKNHDLLIDTILELEKRGIHNYEIIVIGSGNLKINNPIAKKKIKILGRLTYEKMYKVINKSDYILALLDPNNKEHNRYITDGTSGTYQLSYGLLKPLVINEKFTELYKLNNDNSVIYQGNELANAIEKAVVESNKEYQTRVKNLKVLAQNIYQKSLNNLEELIGNNNE